MPENEAFLTRRSIRKFKNEPLSEELITKIIDSGRLSPSAANLQACEFIVVDEKKLRDEVFACLKWAGYLKENAGFPKVNEMPACYIVTVIDNSRSPDWGIIDASAAMATMALTAWSLGVASCWLGSIDKKKLSGLLRVANGFSVEFVLALGFAGQESFKEEYMGDVKYWLDKQDNFHVPKRGLKDVMHRNFFKEK